MDDLDPDLHAGRCTSCGSRLAHDQRYCVVCGARRGPLPGFVEAELAMLAGAGLASAPADVLVPVPAGVPDDAATADPEAQAEVQGGSAGLFDGLIAGRWLLTPRIAALAVMAVLSFGVIAGSLSSPGGAAGLAHTLIVAVAPSAASNGALGAEGTGGAGGGSGGGSGASAAAAAPVTITETQSAPATPAQTQPTVYAPAPSSSGGGGGGSNALNTLPPIKHVFVIMLSDQGYNASFGTPAGHPYLAKTLRSQGELINNYYSVASSSLANGAALISGQGPTDQTAQNCPTYENITPGTLGDQGQAQGDGCVYPSLVQTLPDELAQNGQTWRGYIQGVDQGPAGQPTTCRHPALGAADPNHAPSAQDPYATWRNPFVYFQTLINSGCNTNDVGLSRLSTDLKRVATTPAFSYIAADPCDDGSDTPCHPGAPAGLAAADGFLKSVVPEIEASKAYKQDGLIVITFDQAPQSGPNADNSSCCDQPAFPNLNGGSSSSSSSSTSTTSTTGAASSSTTTGTVSQTLSVPTPLTTVTVPTPLTTTTTSTTTSPGSSTTSSSSTTGASSSTTTSCSSSSTTTSSPSSTTSTGSSTTSTGSSTTSTGSSTTSSGTSTGSASSTTACPDTGTPPGGGQVGALLISRYVKAGSLDAVSDLNHLSLLKTVEDLFGVGHLGYTQDTSLPEFDSAVFNNAG